jgi:hypothetical protein
MAYYVKDLTKQDTEYTARGNGSQYRHLTVFANQVYKWLKEHNVQYIWLGEQTSVRKNTITTYYLTVSIPDKRDATLFMLRWS